MKTFVISLGGSLVVPDAIDVAFLKKFKSLIENKVNEGYRFIITVGGGRTARRYQDALIELGHSDHGSLDWVGIGALRLNAMLVRSALGDMAHAEVINTGPDGIEGIDAPIIVCGAHKPGSSTDYGAVLFAKKVGAVGVVNFSNIDRVYTGDPRKDPTATPIDDITWADFRKLIPTEWVPGLSSPFDPVAAKAAEESGIQVAIVNGTKIEELSHIIEGKPFDGTLIHP